MVKEKLYYPVKEIKEIEKKLRESGSEQDILMHCKICGDLNPKFGFAPIFSYSSIFQTSSVTCNKCSHTDEAYERIFGEPKSFDI